MDVLLTLRCLINLINGFNLSHLLKMPRPTKYESKVQEAAFKFIVVPLLFVLGIYIVSVFISDQIGGDIFKWFLFGAGSLAALAIYFKKQLKEIKW